MKNPSNKNRAAGIALAMEEEKRSPNHRVPPSLLFSVTLNLLFITKHLYAAAGDNKWSLAWSWTSKAASQAEAVAAISCSGHGRAYLDGLVLDPEKANFPSCECNTCFSGSDCSHFDPACTADADSGDPLFLEPFWMKHAESSALVVAGWHRMSYKFQDGGFVSEELERTIRKLHAFVGNAVTDGRYIVFGAGSTQVLNAAIYALSPDNSSVPARVVATIPYYPVYRLQAEFFESVRYEFEGDTSLWVNNSDNKTNLIEFVTSPNNPDGYLNEAVLSSPSAKSIYDRAYYWPHFTPIPAPADEDVMTFTLSKLTGHAGSRFGWALVKDKAVYEKMGQHVQLSSMGVSRDTQLRALKLLKVALEKQQGRDIFEFGYSTMKSRWEQLKSTLASSNRFSLQEIPSAYCTFARQVKEFSPAYAWVKCETEEDKDCSAVLKAGRIIGREGVMFSADARYVRLSLIKSQDDFDVLIQRLSQLVSKEGGGGGGRSTI